MDGHMIGFRKVRIHSPHTIAGPLAVLQVNDTSDMHSKQVQGMDTWMR